jgi:serine protease
MNVLVVAAAGNDGAAVAEPANCHGVVAVAALRHIGTKVAFSNLGPEVTISAPGGNCVDSNPPCLYSIVTTNNTGTESPASGAGMIYVDGNQASVTYSGQTFAGGGVFGTSFSAPMAAGVIALMLNVKPSLTAAQVISILQSSSRPFPATPSGVVSCTDPSATTTPGGIECGCTTSTCGAGMLDAYRAVLAARNFSASPPPASGGGGGGDAPWWILSLLLAGAMRRAHLRGRCRRAREANS